MIEVVRDAEIRYSDTVSLNHLLEQADAQFRQIVIGALIWEGFELDEQLPYLQHPRDILGAIHWVETLDSGAAWEAFRQGLLAAGKIGILVDLSIRRVVLQNSTSSPISNRNHGFHAHQLESA